MFRMYFLGFRRAFDFKGRSSRKEYWGFFFGYYIVMFLFLVLLNQVICMIQQPYYGCQYEARRPIVMLGYCLYCCVTLVPAAAIAVRRVHDRDLHWYYLLIPFYNIVLLFLPGNMEQNQFGPVPDAAMSERGGGTYQPDDSYRHNGMGEPGRRFCAYCGNPVNPSSVFCSKCGKQVQDGQKPAWNSSGGETTMDRQNMVQIFKEIFDKYGVGIIREQFRFQSVVLDFLSGKGYKEEKMVFRNAIESGALLPFAAPFSLTDETAKAVVSELQQRGHLTEEDARFVAQCILAACGSHVTVR